MMGVPILQIEHITKQYPGVKALDGVSFEIKSNTVHCLVGENGAGKSTLIKILSGAVPKTAGSIRFDGQECHFKSIRSAMRAGISVLYQELNVVDELTVAENLTLGTEDTRMGVILDGPRRANAVAVLRAIDPSIRLDLKVEKLPTGKKQILEICKAVAANSRLLIMDEPTAALSEEEVRKLFSIIRKIRERDVTIIYISHRLDEIFEIGQYVTVLRDGKMIATKALAEVEGQDELVQLMIGKTVSQGYLPNPVDYGKKVLEVRGLRNEKLQDISFDAYAGEILGFYGLVGAGKTEIARALFAADPWAGEIRLDGTAISPATPNRAIKQGIAMVPEERRSEGLFLELSIEDNIPVMNYRKLFPSGVVHRGRLGELAEEYIQKLKIATSSRDKPAALLSGGNQQKVVLAKCLYSDARVMLLDEPSRGVDIGAKEEIFKLIRQLSGSGVVSLVFSSELPELVTLCDRILLLFEGRIAAEVRNRTEPPPDLEQMMLIATGGQENYDETE